jgi:hypothetical protein
MPGHDADVEMEAIGGGGAGDTVRIEAGEGAERRKRVIDVGCARLASYLKFTLKPTIHTIQCSRYRAHAQPHLRTPPGRHANSADSSVRRAVAPAPAEHISRPHIAPRRRAVFRNHAFSLDAPSDRSCRTCLAWWCGCGGARGTDVSCGAVCQSQGQEGAGEARGRDAPNRA